MKVFVVCLALALVCQAELEIRFSSVAEENHVSALKALYKHAHMISGNIMVKNDTACWKSSYGRGVGKPVDSCPSDNPDKSGLLCYPNCQEGYYGNGPVCWGTCKDGFTDEGALCAINLKVISADNSNCPWYDKCGLTFSQGCSKCPEGYINDGCTCRIPPNVYAKPSYGRSAGVPLVCAPGTQYDAGLCYNPCSSGHYGIGPVCWADCPASKPFNAGALCCRSQDECNAEAVDMARAVLSAIASAMAAGEDPAKATEAGKAAVEAALKFVLPICA
eukprot:Colp12_sorted_trinity150504_noHs@26778